MMPPFGSRVATRPANCGLTLQFLEAQGAKKMNTMLKVLAGIGALAISTVGAQAQSAYCDGVARNYANNYSNAGNNAVGGALTGALGGALIGGIVGGLQRIQSVANANTKIVPARGPVLSFADITAQVDMYGTIYDRLNQMINKGRGPSEAVEAKVAKEYEAKMGNADEFIRRSAESLWAYLSPDA